MRTANPTVTIDLEGGDMIVLELFPGIAPNTVRNFIHLAEIGFYDETIFHRVIPGFMIQGGDPTGRGSGGPGYNIKGEFAANGFPSNSIMHKAGVISMARASHPDSAGSQFFIMDADAPHLNGQYAAFGKVIDGMDVVHKIANVQRDRNDRPLTAQKIQLVTVDTKGFDYEEPERLTEI